MRKLFLSIFAVLMLSALFITSSADARTAQPSKNTKTTKAATTAPIYWGAHIGDNYGLGTDAPWNAAAMPDFANQMGKAPSLVEFGIWTACDSSWEPCYTGSLSSYAAFPTTQMNAIRSYGAIPVLDVSTGNDTQSMTNQPAWTDAKIASGTYDAYFTQFAKDAKKWNHPFFLRFDWEMNGAWWPWSVGDNSNTAANYVAAWQHVHTIFTSQGVSLASWVWAVNVEPGSTTSFSAEYPGNSYVDWLGMDGYDFGTQGSPSGTFDSIFQQTYWDLYNAGTGKKIMIAEIGSDQSSATKPQFITDSLTEIQEVSGIGAYVYMDKNEPPHNWRIDSSTAALNAFKTGIGSSAFQTNHYGSLSTKP
ncbi:MAG TPA: glycosyl hydrolase [Candidatus Saccharimonadales bacterium]|nr:glycosyl hydrolase [Candidatus Saccharimonadales bacterium]